MDQVGYALTKSSVVNATTKPISLPYFAIIKLHTDTIEMEWSCLAVLRVEYVIVLLRLLASGILS